MEISPFLQDDPLILSVAGSKAGVGKSLFSTNMAIQFAQSGLNTILIDHDRDGANMQALYSLEQSESSSNPSSKLGQFLLEEGIPNLLMIPGGSFGLDSANMDNTHKVKFFNKIKEISSADIVIVDLGGATTEQTLDVFLMSNAGILLSTTEPTDIIQCYEFFKKIIYRTIYRIFRGQGELEQTAAKLLEDHKREHAFTFKEITDMLAQQNPWIAHILQQICQEFDFYLILNQAKDAHEMHLAHKLQSLCHKNLGIELNLPGMLPFDPVLTSQDNATAPLSISSPSSDIITGIHKMAGTILEHMINKISGRPAPIAPALEKSLLS